MTCDRLTVAIDAPHANIVSLITEQIISFGNQHGHIRALITPDAAKGLKLELAETTNRGNENGLDPGALFQIAGAQFFPYEQIPAALENGAKIVCELECLTHEPPPDLSAPKKKRGRKPKVLKEVVYQAEAKDREVAIAMRDLSPLAAVASEVGIQFDPATTWEEYEEIALSVGRANRGLQWIAGDVAHFGEQKFGEQYAQVLDELGYPIETLGNLKWVCGRFPIDRRRRELTFKHHKAVAGMKPETADLWLDSAVKEKWSGSTLEDNIKNERALMGETVKPGKKPKNQRAAAPEPPAQAVEEKGMAGKKLSLKKEKPVEAAAPSAGAVAAKWLLDYQQKVTAITEPGDLFAELTGRVQAAMESLLMLSASVQTVQTDIGNEDIAEENLRVLCRSLADVSPVLIMLERIAQRGIQMVEEAGAE
jgi:hypothetical protein